MEGVRVVRRVRALPAEENHTHLTLMGKTDQLTRGERGHPSTGLSSRRSEWPPAVSEWGPL